MDDNKLLQNNLAEATTEMGFVHVLNNDTGETVVALQREVTLDDGTKVMVEGITPDKMKSALNTLAGGSEEVITFKTPGEPYINGDVEIGGICQAYNESIIDSDVVSIEVTTPPTKTKYTVGDNFDTTGMVVTATYLDGTSEPVTGYTIEPSENLATTDTSVTITYKEKTTTQAITVTELSDIIITNAGGTPAFMDFYSFVTALKNSLSSEILEGTVSVEGSGSGIFLVINGKDEFSSIKFLVNGNYNISMYLFYKAAGGTGSSLVAYSLNESHESVFSVESALNAMIHDLAQEPRYYELDIHSMGDGVSIFSSKNTPLVVTLDDETTYESSINIGNYLKTV